MYTCCVVGSGSASDGTTSTLFTSPSGRRCMPGVGGQDAFGDESEGIGRSDICLYTQSGMEQKERKAGTPAGKEI